MPSVRLCLRAELLPAPYDSMATELLQEYIYLRISISTVDLTRMDERKQINKTTNEIQNKIWNVAMLAADKDPRPVTTGYFISSLNEVIDARGERNAILKRHVPEVILFLLFMVFITTGAIMGYSAGLGMKRA